MRRLFTCFTCVSFLLAASACAERTGTLDGGGGGDSATGPDGRVGDGSTRPDGSAGGDSSAGGDATADAGGGDITQDRICREVFDVYCNRLVGCGGSFWSTAAECVDAFRGDCCGAGCDRVRGDVTAAQISQCTSAFGAVACGSVEGELDSAVCNTVIWGS